MKQKLKKILSITLLTMLLSVSLKVVLADSTDSADAFINPGRFYVSTSNPTEKQSVRLYARVDLSTPSDVNGYVTFYANNNRIGSPQLVTIVSKSWDEVFIDWTPGFGGYHQLKAVVALSSLTDSNPSNNVQYIKDYFVDYDTDGDKVANLDDVDDDNDGLKDNEENEKGTDPLKIDTDGDGVSDKKDAFPLDANKSAPDPVIEITPSPTLVIEQVEEKEEKIPVSFEGISDDPETEEPIDIPTNSIKYQITDSGEIIFDASSLAEAFPMEIPSNYRLHISKYDIKSFKSPIFKYNPLSNDVINAVIEGINQDGKIAKAEVDIPIKMEQNTSNNHLWVLILISFILIAFILGFKIGQRKNIYD